MTALRVGQRVVVNRDESTYPSRGPCRFVRGPAPSRPTCPDLVAIDLAVLCSESETALAPSGRRAPFVFSESPATARGWTPSFAAVVGHTPISGCMTTSTTTPYFRDGHVVSGQALRHEESTPHCD